MLLLFMLIVSIILCRWHYKKTYISDVEVKEQLELQENVRLYKSKVELENKELNSLEKPIKFNR